jgi:hypothetical protein
MSKCEVVAYFKELFHYLPQNTKICEEMLKFLQRKFMWWSSGLRQCTDGKVSTKVLEEHLASIFRAEKRLLFIP